MSNASGHLGVRINVSGGHDKFTIFIQLLFFHDRKLFVISSPKEIFIQCRDFINFQFFSLATLF
jgi:hypothetical protein